MRYFLDLVEGNEKFSDPDGREYPGLHAARDEAIRAARDVIVNDLRDGQPLGLHRCVEIRDDDGAVVEVIPFMKALPTE